MVQVAVRLYTNGASSGVFIQINAGAESREVLQGFKQSSIDVGCKKRKMLWWRDNRKDFSLSYMASLPLFREWQLVG